jgi:hypothetical protein
MNRFPLAWAAVILSAFLLPGCLLVRTTEHRIRLSPDGSGDALLRLIDIRSDGDADSIVNADFNELMEMVDDTLAGGFETATRRITTKQLLLDADTLIGEVAYVFTEPGDIEGLRVTDDELTILVGPDRVVEQTNGSIEKRSEGGVRIVWDRDATLLTYVISERLVRSSTPLAALYRARTR